MCPQQPDPELISIQACSTRWNLCATASCKALPWGPSAWTSARRRHNLWSALHPRLNCWILGSLFFTEGHDVSKLQTLPMADPPGWKKARILEFNGGLRIMERCSWDSSRPWFAQLSSRAGEGQHRWFRGLGPNPSLSQFPFTIFYILSKTEWESHLIYISTYLPSCLSNLF